MAMAEPLLDVTSHIASGVWPGAPELADWPLPAAHQPDWPDAAAPRVVSSYCVRRWSSPVSATSLRQAGRGRPGNRFVPGWGLR